MGTLQFLQNPYVSAVTAALGGIVVTWLTQRVLHKRGTFSYFVQHWPLGTSTEHPIFGSVSIAWNGNSVANLYLSTIELKNESMNDYQDVIIQTYTSNTLLLSEQTQVVDTPNIVEWSDAYKARMLVQPAAAPTEQQWNLYYRQRDYVVPVINRGQIIRFTYLNSATGKERPSIWLSVTQKGVRLKFRGPQEQIYGVPRPHAALVGVIIGLAGLLVLLWQVSDARIVGVVAFTYGLAAQFPGVLAIRLFRKLRAFLTG